MFFCPRLKCSLASQRSLIRPGRWFKLLILLRAESGTAQADGETRRFLDGQITNDRGRSGTQYDTITTIVSDHSFIHIHTSTSASFVMAKLNKSSLITVGL